MFDERRIGMTYKQFKEKIVKIIEQRTEVWSDDSLSSDEFKEKDMLLEREQWKIFNDYPEYYDKWWHETLKEL